MRSPAFSVGSSKLPLEGKKLLIRGEVHSFRVAPINDNRDERALGSVSDSRLSSCRKFRGVMYDLLEYQNMNTKETVEVKVAPSEGMEIEVVDENGESDYVPHWGWHSVLIVNGCATAVEYFDTETEARAKVWE